MTAPGVRAALTGWGERDGDTAVIALVDGVPAGAAWYRYYDDERNIRGYIEERIPVIVIAVDEVYRRNGIGEKMLGLLLEHAGKEGVERISLMVSSFTFGSPVMSTIMALTRFPVLAT